MLEINLISSICEGIYDYTIRHDCSRLFLICMICTYGEMFSAHDSSVLFQGHAYLWFCTANKPKSYTRVWDYFVKTSRKCMCVLKSSL